jgi:hypothetical protein
MRLREKRKAVPGSGSHIQDAFICLSRCVQYEEHAGGVMSLLLAQKKGTQKRTCVRFLPVSASKKSASGRSGF